MTDSSDDLVDLPATARSRFSWWDAAYAGGLAAMAVTVLVFTESDTRTTVIGLAVLGVLGVAYVFLGRQALVGHRDSPAFIGILIACCGVGTYAVGDLASLQALAIPTVWWLGTNTIRRGVWLSVLITVVVLVGFIFGRGITWSSIITAVGFQTLSLSFSIAMGVWMRRIVAMSHERARLLVELQGTQGQLRLANREAGAASERERLARDIHDTITQELTGLVLLAQRAGNELVMAPADAASTISLMESTARSALTEARSLVSINALLPDGALKDVLTRLAVRFERESGVRTTVTMDTPAIPRELEIVLLRCAQEGLSNVRKHSAAHRAWLAVGCQDDILTLTVEDDGIGPGDHTDRDSGFGLAGMQARAEVVGGSARLTERPGGGTSLSVTLPLRYSS